MSRFGNIHNAKSLPDPQLAFRWDMQFPTIGGYSPVVESVGLPSPSIERQVTVLNAKELYYPGITKINTVPVKFYQDVNGSIVGYITAWKYLVKNKNGTYNYKSYYEKTATIKLYTPTSTLGIASSAFDISASLLRVPILNAVAGAALSAAGVETDSPVVTINLLGLFPTASSPQQLDYQGSKEGRVVWEQEFSVADITYSVNSSLLNRLINSSVSQIANQLVGSIFSGAFKY